MNPLIPPNPIWPDEVTPPLQNQATADFVRQLKDDAVALLVPRSRKRLPIGGCYWNVAAIVEKKGGAPVLGWQILWWRQRYFRAMHHAVWCGPDGKLIDVTEPSPTDQRSKVTVFVPDDRIQVSLDRSPGIPNQLAALGDGPVTKALIEAQMELDAAGAALADLAYQCGDRCENQKRAARGGEVNHQLAILAPSLDVSFALSTASLWLEKAKVKLGDAIKRARR